MDHGGIAERDQVHRGAGGRGLVHFHCGDHQVQGRQGHRIRSEPAAEIRDVADPGLREPLRVPCRHREPGGLLQAGFGKDHLPRELAELGLGLGPQPGLREDRRDHFGGVAGLAQRRGEAEGLVLTVRAQRRQQLPALGREDRGNMFLRCVSHAIQRS